jgi:hypothetical protein
MAMLAVAGTCYDREVTEEVARAWAVMLPDVTPDEGRRALEAHIRESPHWPKISDIATRVAANRCPAPDPAAAWGEVYRAIARCGRDREPTWSSPRVAAAVEAIGWRAICDSNTDDVNTLRAQFERFFLAGNRAAQREANVGALERARDPGRALPAGDAVRAVLAQTVKPGGVS